MLAANWATSMAIAQLPFTIDASFQTGINSSYVASIQIMNNSNILVTGLTNFTSNDLNDYYGSIQLFEDGSRNATFPTFPLTTGNGELKKWNDKYYVIAGQEVNRLFSNGYVDTDFGPMFEDEYFSSIQAGDFHIFNDGRILFSGQHLLDDTIRDFEGVYTLVWFSNEGYLDTTRIHRQSNGRMFEFEAYPEGSVAEVEGKFLCSTQGTQYEGQPVGKVFRIHADGALDTTYQSPLSNFGWVQVIHPFPDGSALLGGAMRLVGGTDTLSLLKLLPDGSLDPDFHTASFTITTFFASLTYVHDIEPLIDGRFIVTGTFERIDDVERECIALMNADGTLNLDEFNGVVCGDFENQITPYRGIKGITPAPDGSYYIYGAYHGYHDGTTNYPQQRFISRLYGLDVGIAERNALPPLEPFPNPGAGTFTLELPLNAPATLELLDASGRVVHTQVLPASAYTHTVHSALPAGLYTVRVQQRDGQVRRGKVVVE